ncbi:hypothetical protein Vadar_005164 [Vaccinium darrowii]|uniref:Uncharacterized protein n=1 Tax=Vaccinium darrowii TaxID=229202 RepID=A0ACB7Z2C6_9ERIC|nr:hypothetical protein Vadar_005164 [Vaccinium darrowii]
MKFLDLRIAIRVSSHWRKRHSKLKDLQHHPHVSNPTSSSVHLNTNTNPDTNSVPPPAKKPTTAMDLDLYRATIKGDVDHFIETLVRISTQKNLSLSSIFDQSTPLNNSYLHVASTFGHQDLVAFIAYHFPSLIAAPNSKGNTPLHAAARAEIDGEGNGDDGDDEGYGDDGDDEGYGDDGDDEGYGDDGEENGNGNGTGGEGDNGEENGYGTGGEEDDRDDGDNDDNCGNGDGTGNNNDESRRVVEYLIRNGGEVSFVLNNEGKSPLYIAVESGEVDLVERMLQICTDEGYYSNCDKIEGKCPVNAAIGGRNKGACLLTLYNPCCKKTTKLVQVVLIGCDVNLPTDLTISCIDRRKSSSGSYDYVGTATPPPMILSDQSEVVNEEDEEGDKDSTMELDRLGEEKKKRWDAKAAVRSGVGRCRVTGGGGGGGGGERERERESLIMGTAGEGFGAGEGEGQADWH